MRIKLPRDVTLVSLCTVVFLLNGCSSNEPDKAAQSTKKSRAHLVEVEIARYEPVSTASARTGSLRYRRLVDIYSQEEGRLVAVRKFEGDTFSAGENLVRLEDDLLRAELAKAQATTRQAKLDRKRMRRLADQRAASEDQLAQAETAVQIAEADEQLLRTRLAYTRIDAPFDGVVTARKLEPGSVVAKHTHLMTIADPASLMIELPVSELLLPLVKQGDPTRVRIDALGPREFTGRINRIHPVLDPTTRQGTVEIVLAPIPKGARAGQFARVILQTTEVKRLLVTFAALRRDREGEYVYLMVDGKARKTPVRSGVRIKDQVEILDGIATGDQVISKGFLGLSPGKQVVLAGRADPAIIAAKP